MSGVTVHPRVHQRHPEFTDEDVVSALHGCVRATARTDKGFVEYLLVGIDRRGRLVELVARFCEDGDPLVYHAMTPPAKKTLRQLGLARR